MLTPEQKSQRARIAGLTRAANCSDPSAHTSKARLAFRKTFEDLADPDHILPEADRLRRADLLRRAHYAKLSFASSRARSKAADKNETTKPVALVVSEVTADGAAIA